MGFPDYNLGWKKFIIDIEGPKGFFFQNYMSLRAITEHISSTGTASSLSCNGDWDIYKMFFGVCNIGLIQICISQSEL